MTNTSNTIFYAYDDDGCGGSAGHAQLTFNPPTSGIYFIKVHGPGCSEPNEEQTGTLWISCGQAFCPGNGNEPCANLPLPSCNPNFSDCGATEGAIPFPSLSSTCTTLNGTTLGMTGTQTVAAPNCGIYPNTGDVWFTVPSSDEGTLALDLSHQSATNLAMALYSVTGTCPSLALTQVACNADINVPTDLDPYINVGGLEPSTTYYIRVWPEANSANGGTFQLCAYWPVPPANDQPCGAIALDMSNTVCVPATFNTQDATALHSVTTQPSSPTCTTANPGSDLWFTLTVPEDGRVTIQTAAGSLTNMAMAVYTGPCTGPLTQAACNDNGPENGNMPALTTAATYATGQVLWIRVWSQSSAYGTFDICAYMAQPPVNDNPCGALPLNVQFGCLMTTITTEFATQTPTDLFGTGSIPDPSCGGAPQNDVWFSAVVPPNGELALDMDDGIMNNAAFAVYRFLDGDCPDGGELVEIANSCATSGSTNGGAGSMPAQTITGLTPGATVYIRVWRQSGPIGTAFLCLRRTDSLPVQSGVSCYYTLRMTDTGGNGWNGSYVTIQIGAEPAVNYTIPNGLGSISFPVAQFDPVMITYTAVGGFQNEISYLVVDHTNGLIFGSTSPPNVGFNYLGGSSCYPPPPGPNDCDQAYFRVHPSLGNPYFPAQNSSGQSEDLNGDNQGCLQIGEQNGTWLSFLMLSNGPFAYEIEAFSPENTDFDFALWGPLDADDCPPTTQPIRCSFAAGAGSTGLNFVATDETEDESGDGWVAHVDVLAGEEYLMIVNGHTTDVGTFLLNPILPTQVYETPIAPGALRVLPNPAARADVELVLWNEGPGTLSISFSDAAGRTVHQIRIAGTSGEQRIPVSVDEWAAGIYNVRVSDPHRSRAEQTRLVVMED